MKCFFFFCGLLLISNFVNEAAAAKRNEALLHRFGGRVSGDGAGPIAGLIMDQAGNFYGTTSEGGTGPCRGPDPIGCGTIFELSPPSTKGSPWTETVLYNFVGGSDGYEPTGALVFDSAGNLYGTTFFGGKGSCQDGSLVHCGTAFELKPPSIPGGTWTEHVIYRFAGGSDGYWPASGLVFDSAGNLYGTTEVGGNSSCSSLGCGTVFQLRPPSGVGGSWTKTALYNFADVPDASTPIASLIFDSVGNLYGTTSNGGASNLGSVFELSLLTSPQGNWSESVLYSFGGGSDGERPQAGLWIDSKGDLYGTTGSGGTSSCSSGCGTVFELSQSGPLWQETILWRFMGGNDGIQPSSSLIADGDGNLYGTTLDGGTTSVCASGTEGCGTIFKLTPPSWTESVIYSFKGGFGDGVAPTGVVLGSQGALFGTSQGGGISCPYDNHGFGCGTIFGVIP